MTLAESLMSACSTLEKYPVASPFYKLMSKNAVIAVIYFFLLVKLVLPFNRKSAILFAITVAFQIIPHLVYT